MDSWCLSVLDGIKKSVIVFCLLSPLSRDPEMDDIPEALEKHRELYEKAKEIEQRLTEEISVIY